MKARNFALTVLGLVATAAVAVPAHAVTFADFAAADSSPNMTWSSGTLTGSGETNFSFLTLAPAYRNLAADYTFSATSSDPATQQNVPGLGLYDVQPGLSGTFAFTYDGPTTGGLTAGETLLSGTFSGASIAGPDGGSTGSLQDAIISGGTVTFASPLLTFSPAGDKGDSISLTSLLPGLNINRSGALANFTGVSTGSFSSDLVGGGGGGGGVPEPATWAMMLVGFAGVGFARRATLAAQRSAVR